MDSFPILSIIAYMPALGALAILLMTKGSGDMARKVALVASLVSLVLSIVLLAQFDRTAEFQFTEHAVWLDALGVAYFLGVDGDTTLAPDTVEKLEAEIVSDTRIGQVCTPWRSSQAR